MVQITAVSLSRAYNYSKLDVTSCNARPVEVAKVPVQIAAKGFLAFLLMDPRSAERQQKLISNYKDDWKKSQTTTNSPTPLHLSQVPSAGLSSSLILPNYSPIHWRAQKRKLCSPQSVFSSSTILHICSYFFLLLSYLNTYPSTKSTANTKKLLQTLLFSQTSILMYHSSC